MPTHEIRTQVVVICDPTRYQLDRGGVQDALADPVKSDICVVSRIARNHHSPQKSTWCVAAEEDAPTKSSHRVLLQTMK